MPAAPKLADWLFSLRCFAAAMLALWIALRFGLPRPYWALSTVYIVSQGFAGAVWAKAVWRFVGTAVGGVFAIIALPNLIDAPVLFCLAIALWIGLCVALSLYDPTPRSYAFALSGYSAALIAFPIVDAPGDVFLTAVYRCEEIGLGIACAWLFHGVLFPRAGTPMARGAARRWLADLARFGADSLTAPHDATRFSAERRRIARDGAALNALFLQARYEVAGRRAPLLWLPRLHEQGRVLPTLLSAIGERSRALTREDPAAAAALRPALEELAAWMRQGAESLDADPATSATRLRARLEAAAQTMAAIPPGSAWTLLLREGLLERLRELTEIWEECLGLISRILAAEDPAEAPPAPLRRAPGHVDPLLVGLSGLASMLAVLLGCAFWIGSGWSRGTSLPMMAAAALSIFAQLDNPAPLLKQFILGSVLAVLLAGLYLFVLMPQIDGFVLLACALGLSLIPVAAFVPQPTVMALFLAITVTMPAVMNLEESYSADFPAFADGGLATIIALMLALVIVRVARSFGVQFRVRRLAEADRRDLALLAEGRSSADMRRILAVMLDRFEALAARLGATDAPLGVAELADLRASLNLLRLRQRLAELPAQAQPAIATLLAALAAEARGQGDRDTLLRRLDAALSVLLAGAPAGRAAGLAAQSLSGIRLALFPGAAPPALPGTPQP